MKGQVIIIRIFKILIIINFSILLTGCAGVLPVPGGSETVNKNFYNSPEDLKERVKNLKTGVTKTDAFAYLNKKEDEFVLLTREEIMSTLYGGQRLEFVQNTGAPSLNERDFIKSLSGYKLIFKNVDRKHGVSSPISMRTNESGYSYAAVFIFKDGLLYEEPVLSGGMIDTSSSKTIFDFMSPGLLMSRVGL